MPSPQQRPPAIDTNRAQNAAGAPGATPLRTSARLRGQQPELPQIDDPDSPLRSARTPRSPNTTRAGGQRSTAQNRTPGRRRSSRFQVPNSPDRDPDWHDASETISNPPQQQGSEGRSQTRDPQRQPRASSPIFDQVSRQAQDDTLREAFEGGQPPAQVPSRPAGWRPQNDSLRQNIPGSDTTDTASRDGSRNDSSLAGHSMRHPDLTVDNDLARLANNHFTPESRRRDERAMPGNVQNRSAGPADHQEVATPSERMDDVRLEPPQMSAQGGATQDQLRSLDNLLVPTGFDSFNNLAQRFSRLRSDTPQPGQRTPRDRILLAAVGILNTLHQTLDMRSPAVAELSRCDEQLRRFDPNDKALDPPWWFDYLRRYQQHNTDDLSQLRTDLEEHISRYDIPVWFFNRDNWTFSPYISPTPSHARVNSDISAGPGGEYPSTLPSLPSLSTFPGGPSSPSRDGVPGRQTAGSSDQADSDHQYHLQNGGTRLEVDDPRDGHVTHNGVRKKIIAWRKQGYGHQFLLEESTDSPCRRYSLLRASRFAKGAITRYRARPDSEEFRTGDLEDLRDVFETDVYIYGVAAVERDRQDSIRKIIGWQREAITFVRIGIRTNRDFKEWYPRSQLQRIFRPNFVDNLIEAQLKQANQPPSVRPNRPPVGPGGPSLAPRYTSSVEPQNYRETLRNTPIPLPSLTPDANAGTDRRPQLPRDRPVNIYGHSTPQSESLRRSPIRRSTTVTDRQPTPALRPAVSARVQPNPLPSPDNSESYRADAEASHNHRELAREVDSVRSELRQVKGTLHDLGLMMREVLNSLRPGNDMHDSSRESTGGPY
ncbi:hypothetical protein BDV97DRAFT_398573 [Delphinella strobiligena]|nr:hypothetical protein BDV97DRAFT_398573 [Delphinella strobiligena]